MQKQFIPAALALILALSAGSSYAPANPPDNGGCPPPQSGFVAREFGHFIPADRNEDGITCWKERPGHLIIIDNRFPHRGRRL